MNVRMTWRLLGCLLAVLWPAAGALAQPRYTFESTETVLPKAVRPERVQLQLALDPAADSFRGEAVLHVAVAWPVQTIELHAQELQAGDARLEGRGAPRPLAVEVDDARHTWRLRPADGRPIDAGRWRVVLRWQGRVNGSAQGLFRVDVGAPAANERWLTTQLEAVHARRLLPSFDEPVFRSVFEVSVLAPPGYDVLSNMPRRTRAVTAAGVLHRFAPTPPMQVYLLAVSVGRFGVLSGRAAGVPLRFVSVPGRQAQARWALESTQQLLPFYERYFGQRYRLPKLDQIAAPGVRGNAMEDWGLISYAEDLLLFDPATSDPATREHVFGIVAHEVSHQWFGNLVSPASWSEIWLNEAFATWMADKATIRFHPEWQRPLTLRAQLERVLDRDAGPSTRAIRAGPVSEGAVDSVFDGITYGKGGAVLAMLERWIGEDAFRRGLQAYMAERRLQPATAGDLWHHIGNAEARPVAEVAASWTDQPGVPLLEVATRCEGDVLRIELRQQRFSLGAPLAPATWRIPLVLARGAEERRLLLEGAGSAIDWPGCSGAPLRANAGAAGYYRVAYDEASAAALRRGFGTLPGPDQLALLGDSFALARAGRQPMADHFRWLAAAVGARGPAAAVLGKLATTQLLELDTTLHGSASQPALRSAARALLAPLLAQLGWQPQAGEAQPAQQLRAALVGALARFGDTGVRSEAQRQFDAALQPGRVAPSLRSALLEAATRGADAAQFERLLAALKQAGGEEERNLLIQAAAAVEEPSLVDRLLAEVSAGGLPRRQALDAMSWLGWRPDVWARVYAHTLEHWAALAELGGAGGGRFWLLPEAASGANDAAVAERLRADQLAHAGADGASEAERVAAAITARARVREREGERLGPALAALPP